VKDIVLELRRLDPVPTRALTLIDGIALHHSGDEGSPYSWARYHTSSPAQHGPSWGPANSIGYHVAVMRNGDTFKTAYDRDRVPGVAWHNDHLIHLVCQGNFARIGPGRVQLESLLRVVQHYRRGYPKITVGAVRTHSEWQTAPEWATACPGIGDLGRVVRFLLDAGFGE